MPFRKRLKELGYCHAADSGYEQWWCPLHEQSGEHGPSFSVTVGEDGKDFVYCYGQCDQRELFEFISRGIREDTLPVCQATMPPLVGGGWGKGGYGNRISQWSVITEEDCFAWYRYTSRDNVPVETDLYIYRDAHGTPVTAKQRWSDKHFTQLRLDGKTWRLGLKGATHPLYHSDFIAAKPDETVWAVEGEKDADRLATEGLVSTSTRESSAVDVLAGRFVVVIPDNDAAGRSTAATFALRAAQAGAKEVRVLPPLGGDATGGKRGVGDGYDVADFLDGGGTVIHLHELAASVEPLPLAQDQDQGPTVEAQPGGGPWEEVDLTRYLDNPTLPEPTRLARDDGMCLLYPGETAWIFGEPGCGKTWTSLYAAGQEIAQGHHVVWFDFEGQGMAVVNRLLVLGRTNDELRKFLHLVEPETPYVENMRPQLDALIGWKPTLAVFDAANDVLTLQGGRLNDPDAIAKFDMMLLLPFKRAGAAVAVIDHVPKNAENQGWPINSGHKMACSTVAYSIAALQQFRPDRDGASRIVVRKDRHGNAPAPRGDTAAYFVLRNGTFVLAASQDLAAIAREAYKDGDMDAVIITAVESEPGTHHVKSLADQLTADPGGSVSTWTRRINKLIKDNESPIRLEDGTLWKKDENEDT